MNQAKLKLGMNYLLRSKLVLSVLLSLPAWVSAADFSVSTGLQYTDLIEYGRDNQQLDQETGYLPSIKLAAYWHTPDDALLELSYTIARGDLSYNGQTQSGADFNTLTQTQFNQASITLETPALLTSDFGTQRVQLSYAMHQWQRDIQGKGLVSHLNEDYDWHSVKAGLVHRSSSAKFKWALGVLTTRQDHLKLAVPNLAYGKVDLPSGNGWFTNMEYEFAQSTYGKWLVGFEYQYLQRERSVNGLLYGVNHASPIGSFAEPKHTLEQLIGLITFVF